MSYLRAGYPLKYVEGESEDYVFPHSDGYIEDYGKITNEGIVELLFRYWKTEDTMFKEHLLKRLAEKLNVKLRDKPLTEEEGDKLLENKRKLYDDARRDGGAIPGRTGR